MIAESRTTPRPNWEAPSTASRVMMPTIQLAGSPKPSALTLPLPAM